MNLRMGLAVGLSLAAAVAWSGEGKVVLGHGWDILDASRVRFLGDPERPFALQHRSAARNFGLTEPWLLVR